MLLEVLTLQFVYGSGKHEDEHTAYFYIGRESFKAEALPVCHLQLAAAHVEGILVGSEVVAVLDRGLCSSSSPVLVNSPPFDRSCLYIFFCAVFPGRLQRSLWLRETQCRSSHTMCQKYLFHSCLLFPVSLVSRLNF